MKGVSLEIMVGLIIAILAAAVILLIVFTSGLISNFKETVGITLIMLSAYMRIVIVSILNQLLTWAAVMLAIVAAISMFRLAKSETFSFLRMFFKAFGESTWGLIGVQAGISGSIGIFLLVLYATMVNSTFAAIPFFGSTINVHLGDAKNPYNYTLVADGIANRIDTTWKAMGANSGNPLEGLNNQPNPYPIFVIFPYPNQTLNMSYVYKRLVKEYGKPDYDIYVYCENSQGILGSKPVQSNINPFCWDKNNPNCNELKYTKGRLHYSGVCNITNKSKIYIEYTDVLTGLTAPLAPSGIHKDNNCPYMRGVGNLDRDVIAICIK